MRAFTQRKKVSPAFGGNPLHIVIPIRSLADDKRNQQSVRKNLP